jgi:hypothetical protein
LLERKLWVVFALMQFGLLADYLLDVGFGRFAIEDRRGHWPLRKEVSAQGVRTGTQVYWLLRFLVIETGVLPPPRTVLGLLWLVGVLPGSYVGFPCIVGSEQFPTLAEDPQELFSDCPAVVFPCDVVVGGMPFSVLLFVAAWTWIVGILVVKALRVGEEWVVIGLELCASVLLWFFIFYGRFGWLRGVRVHRIRLLKWVVLNYAMIIKEVTRECISRTSWVCPSRLGASCG